MGPQLYCFSRESSDAGVVRGILLVTPIAGFVVVLIGFSGWNDGGAVLVLAVALRGAEGLCGRHTGRRLCGGGIDEGRGFAECLCLLRRGGGEKMEQAGDDAGPAGLVASADARAVVAVEVFVEQHQFAPVGVVLKDGGGAV